MIGYIRTYLGCVHTLQDSFTCRVYHLPHDCHFGIDRDVSTTYCRTLSGDSVDLLSQTVCLRSKHRDQYRSENCETNEKLNPLCTLSNMIDIFHDTIWCSTSSNDTELEHTLHIMPKRLTERVWFSQSRFSLLNVYLFTYILVGFSPLSYLFSSVMAQIPVDTTLKCGAKPIGIRYVMLHPQD